MTDDTNDMMEQQTPEQLAAELRQRAACLQRMGRNDLLLQAIGVPLLEQLRIEAARGNLSQLHIDTDYRFFLTAYNNREVELSPVHKAVYLLFLNHPEGIEFKRLGTYRTELLRLYKETSRWTDVDKVAMAVDRLGIPSTMPSMRNAHASNAPSPR